MHIVRILKVLKILIIFKSRICILNIGIRRFPSRWKNVLCRSFDFSDDGSSESGKLTWNGRYIYNQLKNRFFKKAFTLL